MTTGFLAMQSQQISWLPIFGISATNSRLSLMHLPKFSLVRSILLGHCFPTTLVYSIRPTSWKHWPIRLNNFGLSFFLASESWVRIFNFKSGNANARKYSGPNPVWSGAMCPVISFDPFSKEILIWLVYFKPSLINLSGMPLAPRGVQQVYQLNWSVAWALIGSDIVR